MAARETRAFIQSQGDFYLCPLPARQLAADEVAVALAVVWRGQQALTPVYRQRDNGEPELIAEGYERLVPMTVERAGTTQHWAERRLVVRSVRQARAAEAALRARVAQAVAAIEGFNRCGRGKKRCTEVAAIRQAAAAVLERYGVGGLVRLRYDEHVHSRPVRHYRDRPARVREERQVSITGEVEEAAVEAAARRWGWRVYGTNHPGEQLSLERAVLADRNEYLVERSLGRLKGRPLSLPPRYVQRDDHATGLIRLWSIGLWC
jgi:transposase